jgi:hypothetical protein
VATWWGAARKSPVAVGRERKRGSEGRECNNPNFWEIEINGFIKIPNFGDNKNFYFEYEINSLCFKTCEFEHLLTCFK